MSLKQFCLVVIMFASLSTCASLDKIQDMLERWEIERQNDAKTR